MFILIVTLTVFTVTAVIGPISLMAPVMWHGAPWSTNLGRFGMLLASHLCHISTKYLFQVTTETGREKARDRFDSFLDCLVSKSMTMLGSTGIDNSVPEEIKIRLGADAFALKVINEVFKKVYTADNSLLPDFMVDIPPKNLMFISLAQLHCGTEKSTIIPEYAPIPDFHRAILPMMHDDVFAEAFNCAKGTKMNPVDRCVFP